MMKRAIGSKTVFKNELVAQHGDVLVVSVKPQVVNQVLPKIINSKKLVVSIAAGISISSLEQNLPKGTRVIRAMPNTAATIGHSASVFMKGTHATKSDIETVERLFSSVGLCEQVHDEQLIDVATALAGSGPAYIYMIIEALADGAVKMGMTRQLAYSLASQTVLGAGTMVQHTDNHPAQLKDDVASPAGSTITAIHHLEKHGLRSALIGAIEAATLRCREINEKTNKKT
ncbi:pyrroline-5-carboxylate reductase 1, mitochondrial isoform X2 [Chelonus insularis]|uniref:pyrroline-5-carboxylate reductase 1, mitochondrial isoform X2 n=1 Tax=Chelonus insularis TaxID=460826 RepID=UPI00158B5462|nr:pyrroline-5-carboxylate reductase 1, mitochondrial isoform X2 [Chelonus insularis]